MSSYLIDKLPGFIDADDARYWLTVNKAEDGTWCAAYKNYEADPERPGEVEVYKGWYLNSCTDLDEVYYRFHARFQRHKL